MMSAGNCYCILQLINSIGDEINHIYNDINAPASDGSSPLGTDATVIENIPSADMNILRVRASEALERSRCEIEEINFELSDKVLFVYAYLMFCRVYFSCLQTDKLAQMRHQLDAYRESLLEKTNDIKADEFYSRNMAVLRGAYR